MIFIVREETEQKESQEEIRCLAYRDLLTRLPNRRYFYESFNKALEDAEKNNIRLTASS